jgi:c-di-AMP phosphodiesterase-like protein
MTELTKKTLKYLAYRLLAIPLSIIMMYVSYNYADAFISVLAVVAGIVAFTIIFAVLWRSSENDAKKELGLPLTDDE